jgi:hypothetical protein
MLACISTVKTDSRSPFGDILEAELFRLNGLGRVIRVEHRGGRLFLSVVRLMIGQFAYINFFQTGTLQKLLASVVEQRSGSAGQCIMKERPASQD